MVVRQVDSAFHLYVRFFGSIEGRGGCTALPGALSPDVMS